MTTVDYKTTTDKTHHCASCEELQVANTGLLLNLEAQRMEAKEITAKVAELQRHNAMLAVLLDRAIDAMCDLHENLIPDKGDGGNAEIEVQQVRNFVDAHAELLYDRNQSSSAQSAAWLEASHIEWMRGLPVVAYAAPRNYALAWFETDRCTIPLYALPTKEVAA